MAGGKFKLIQFKLLKDDKKYAASTQLSITFCFIALLAILLLWSLFKSAWVRTTRLAFNLPGPPALPLFGNVFLVKDNIEFVIRGLQFPQKYGRLFRIWIALIPTIVVSDPKHIQIILGNNKHINKNFLYTFMHTFLGEGLLTNNGIKWKLCRKHVQPLFHVNALKIFVETFVESAQLLAEQLHNKRQVKITSYVNNCVLNILHRAFLGIPIKDYETKSQSPFNKGQLMLIRRLCQPWFIFNFVYRMTSICKEEITQQLTLQQFAKKILDQRRQTNAKEWCFLDAFIGISEDDPSFTEKQVIDEICTFMLAGQDSVGAAVSFALYNIAKHPEVQDKIVEEVNETLKQHSSITVESLNDMKYLEQCIKESLRLYPSVPLISKKLSEDVKLDNYVLPAGADVFISPMLTQRLKDHYPNPEVFDPERFKPENIKNRNPYSFIPFSAGPRNCIGYKFAYLEMKTIISTILRRYKLSIPANYKLQMMYRVTLRAKGGIILELSPR
ncbi:hypothetical protein FQA39_LY16148 [Lamprigera yunnana]|nr:hypothetical protein FQA39_LY16148 [Lamprigera yunnana]